MCDMMYNMDARGVNWPVPFTSDQVPNTNNVASFPAIHDSIVGGGGNRLNANCVNTFPNTISRPPPPYNNAVQQFSLDQYNIVQLWREARAEYQNPQFIGHVSIEKQYEKRIRLQRYLATLAKDRALFNYIMSDRFLRECFVTGVEFGVIEKVSGLTRLNIRELINNQLAASNTQAQQAIHLPQQSNAQSHSNFSQFQINSRINVPPASNSFSGTNPSSYTQQSGIYTSSQQSQAKSQVYQSTQPQVSRSVGSCDPSPPAARSWYNMPTERYEAGRPVSMHTETHQQPLPYSHSHTSSQPNTPATQISSVASQPRRQSPMSTQGLPTNTNRACSDVLGSSHNAMVESPCQNGVQSSVINHVNRHDRSSQMVPTSQPVTSTYHDVLNRKRTISEGSESNETLATCSSNVQTSPDPVDSKKQLREMIMFLDKTCSENTSDNVPGVTDAVHSNNTENAEPPVTVTNNSNNSPGNEKNSSPHQITPETPTITNSNQDISEELFPLRQLQGLVESGKHSNCVVDESSNMEQTNHSIGEYNPPLPVITHKKREHRISPLKKPHSNTSPISLDDTGDDGSDSHFSLFDNYVMPVSDQQEGASVLTQSKESAAKKDDNFIKRRHKSSEVTSSCSPKDKIDRESNKTPPVSAREKVYSSWCNKEQETEANGIAKHARRRSCPGDYHVSRPGKPSRSNTWDATSKDNLNRSSLNQEEFVWLHGKQLLQLIVNEDKYVLMKELIAQLLSRYDTKEVFRKKTKELGICHKPLPHQLRKDVEKYFDSQNIYFNREIGVIELSDAQRLLHCIRGITECQDTCISFQHTIFCELSGEEVITETTDTTKSQSSTERQLIHEKRNLEDDSAESKNRSDSPDSTMNNSGKRASSELSVCKDIALQDGLQQNQVSSQSIDQLQQDGDDEDETSSNVSDATDLYCDGKPVPLENVSSNGGGLGTSGDGQLGDGSCAKLTIHFKGGVAVFAKANMANRFIRFVTIRGNKCFLYQDLFRLFGQAEVVNIVIINSMRLKNCSQEEADYLNQQTRMAPVRISDSFLQQKYAMKIFSYFGEVFPTERLPIQADLDKFKEPPKLHVDSREEQKGPQTKRQKTTGKLVHTDVGCKRKRTADDGVIGENRDSDCLQSELESVKEELKKMKQSNHLMGRMCKAQEDELARVKGDIDEMCRAGRDREKQTNEQKELISKLNSELAEKEEKYEDLMRERNHFKDMVEKMSVSYEAVDEV